MELTKAISGHLSLKAFCDHCGNITLQTIVNTEVIAGEAVTYTYTLSRCQICDGVALRRHPGDWNAPLRPGEKPLGRDIPFEQLWPEALTLPGEVPERVRQIYQEARIVKRQSPSSFVVQVRRALEAVANDQKAEGSTLQAKTQWLIKNGSLPEVFGEMTHISRMIGNLGAHDVANDVSTADAEIADEFFRAVVEYLYVAQTKVERVRMLLKKG